MGRPSASRRLRMRIFDICKMKGESNKSLVSTEPSSAQNVQPSNQTGANRNVSRKLLAKKTYHTCTKIGIERITPSHGSFNTHTTRHL